MICECGRPVRLRGDRVPAHTLPGTQVRCDKSGVQVPTPPGVKGNRLAAATAVIYALRRAAIGASDNMILWEREFPVISIPMGPWRLTVHLFPHGRNDSPPWYAVEGPAGDLAGPSVSPLPASTAASAVALKRAVNCIIAAVNQPDVKRWIEGGVRS